MRHKIIWLENLVFFNECVQKSGGTMTIVGSFTDNDGDVFAQTTFTQLKPELEKEYDNNRKRGKELSDDR